jgi:signal transduction histidine kinase
MTRPWTAPLARGPVRGVLLTLAVVIVLELLESTVLRITAPGIVLSLAVAYAAYRGGVTGGLASAVLASGYVYHVAHTPLPPDGFFTTPDGRVLIVATVLGGVALLVGRLRGHLNREMERERDYRRAAESHEQKLRDVLESMGEGFLLLDRDWCVLYANARAEVVLARKRDSLLGKIFWDEFPEGRNTRAFRMLDHAVRHGTNVEFEEEYEPAQRWFEIRGYPADDGIAVYFRDVTRTRLARRRVEQAQRLLADTGAALAATLDVTAMIDAFSRVLVPEFADAVVATLRQEDGTLHRLAPYADPPDLQLESALPPGEEQSKLIRRAVDEDLTIVLGRDQRRDDAIIAAREAGYRSGVLVPLSAGGRTRGTLLMLARDAHHFDDARVRLARELAHRAGFALDNLRLYESAMLANQAKSDFLAVMSHELRTPLTTVMGYTDLMLSGLPEPLPHAAQRYAQRVQMAAWHLLAIIEQILIYTRLDVGTETVQPQRASVADVLQDAAGMIEPVAREKGVDFVLEPPAEAIAFDTDITKLRQILVNLLSNAIRFTDRGYVKLAAHADGADVCFIVEDTGIGIAAADLDRIFDPFWQVDQSATRRVGGTGLGLSVARRLARLLGGDVTVSSTENVGTRFTVRLPLRREA